jgi:methionyl-tRNA formyltransferase
MVMNILIYGSTYLTQKVCEELLKHDMYNIIGYIPSVNPTIKGIMPPSIKLIKDTNNYDIAISIQYDKKITSLHNCFNLHTGLLPEWGGCDILYHSIKQKVQYQGLTFHKITDQFDCGEIISKISYPILPDDSVLDLYDNMVLLSPLFVKSSIDLLYKIGINNLNKLKIKQPTIYKRGNILEKDIIFYKETLIKLKNKYENL